MSHYLVILICFAGIAYLFWVDRKQSEGVSRAIWIPLAWMFFAASRFPSQWLDLGTPNTATADVYDEGNPLNRNVFLALIVAGLAVLGRRRINWGEVLAANPWVLLFFVFALTSTVWADDAGLSFKRWVKGVGDVIMALVILTDKRPYQALGVVLRRLAFLLLPLSVLFIKYYPQFGRAYAPYGEQMFTGVAMQKNGLGQLCLLVGLYFAWELLFRRLKPVSSEGRVPAPVALIVVPMLLWLLYRSQSATAFAALFGALCFLAVARLPFFARVPRRIIGAGLSAAFAIGLLEYGLGITAWAIEFLGRAPDLTERVPMWEMLLRMAPNAWIGAGYEAFWSGDRLREIWERMGHTTGFLQAHNGYIDAYLNVGIIGLALIVLAIAAGLLKAQRQLEREYAYAVLKIALILVAIAYNYTEAAFKPVHNVFLLLLVAILEVPRARASRRVASSAVQPPDAPPGRQPGRSVARSGPPGQLPRRPASRV
jgi:O-antigen ligase